MARTLCVIAVVLAAQFVSGEAGAASTPGDAPLALKGLSPGQLQLGFEMGGGDGDPKPPLEPGRMVLEALMGLPPLVLYAFIDAGLIRAFGTTSEPLRPGVRTAFTYLSQPAATAVLQMIIGNTSMRTRVAFLPSFVAGMVANALVLGAVFLLVPRGDFVSTASSARGFVLLGTPIVQMVALNEFREAKPLDSQAKLEWPEPAYASAAQSRRLNVPLALLRF